MVDSQHTPFGLTIRDALTAASQRGYATQFVLSDGQITAADSASPADPADVEVHIVWRIEGASDAADQLLVAALVTPAGERGTLLLSYGPMATVEDSSVLNALDVQSAEAGLPPDQREN